MSLKAIGSTERAVNASLYCLVLAFVITYPLLVCFFFLFVGKKGLEHKVTRRYFSALYSGIDLSYALNTQYVTLFLLRRFAIGLAIAFLRPYLFTQLLVFQVTSMVVLTTVVSLRPYESRLKNVVEIANECLVILTVYMMYGFSHYIPSKEYRYKLGWVYIGIVAAVFVINIGAIIHGIVTFVLRKVKEIKASRTKAKKVSSNDAEIKVEVESARKK